MNPYDPVKARKLWLRWQVSAELATSIAPGLETGDDASRRMLVDWLKYDRQALVSHVLGAMGSEARHAGIAPFTRDDICHEIDLVASSHRVRREPCISR